MENTLIEIGKIVNTHGIKGEVKVQPWCDDPAMFDEFDALIIDNKPYNVLKNRFHKNCEIVQFEGINNIDDAELLRNKVVYVNRDEIKVPEGRHFISDIIGLLVKEESGRVLGIVDDIIKTGSNDVYILKDTFNKKQILIPVIDQVVKEINIEQGYILVELMKGLIDE